MLKQLILDSLRENFPKQSFHTSESDRIIAIFYAKHPKVGNVVIYDDELEITIEIENITHGHFSCYDDSLSREEQYISITKDIINFLTDLLSDKVLLYKAIWHSGWRILEKGEPVNKHMKKVGYQYFLWSGPMNI